jgi:cell division topological specificity factor
MIDFLKRIFGIQPPASGATAKERLRLVLLSDHLSLAPDVVDSMKRDLLEVISRYVEIDASQADVTFEQRDREIAMLASVPVRAVRNRPLPPPAAPLAAPPLVAVESAPALSVVSTEPEDAAPALEPAPGEPAPLEPAPVSAAPAPSEPASIAPGPAQTGQPPSPRRRRRRKKSSGGPPLQMIVARG